MGGEAATPTRCSAARWFRSLVLALSKCLVAAAPKIRPVVSMASAGGVAGRAADCKMLDWLPHFLRREHSNGRVAMQMQLELAGKLAIANGGGCARKSSLPPSKMLSGNDMGK